MLSHACSSLLPSPAQELLPAANGCNVSAQQGPMAGYGHWLITATGGEDAKDPA